MWEERRRCAAMRLLHLPQDLEAERQKMVQVSVPKRLQLFFSDWTRLEAYAIALDISFGSCLYFMTLGSITGERLKPHPGG